MTTKRVARLMSSVLVASLLGLGVPVVPVGAEVIAATTYTGGLIDYPRSVNNDHSVFGVTFSVAAGSGLEPNTTYNAKIRFTEGSAPSPGTNRGFTWNESAGAWVQEGSSWVDFPQVTTAPDGSISSRWFYGKFADETKAGTYYLMISLNPAGTVTYNPTIIPTVTVLDSETQGALVHNGVAIGQTQARVELTDPASSTVVWSLGKSELNFVDSDSNGAPDDASEDRGPVGLPGDYSLAASADAVCSLYIKRALVLANAVVGPADTDVALGAADMTPPSAPSALKVSGAADGLALTWGPATDAGGSGLVEYRVYRSVVPTQAKAFTPVKELMVQLGSADSGWTDTSADPEFAYEYEVRAVDGATNVGPRVMAVLPEPPPPAGEVTRTAGADRYDTALNVSRSSFATASVDTVVIATGRNFPDALAAAGLAGLYRSPVLLVGDSVTQALLAEIDRLGATDVAIVGGEAAVPASVEDRLAQEYTVDRIAGLDRYATAATVAAALTDSTASLTGDVFVARGDAFPDALAAAPYSYSQVMPVLLVKRDTVPASTSAALVAYGAADAVVLGGTSAVSAQVETTLGDLATGTVVRWYGEDRYATAADAATNAVAQGWADWPHIGMATGLNYPDALGGAAAIGAQGGVLLLTAPQTLSIPAAETLAAHAEEIELVSVFGGEGAVSAAVYNAIAALLP